MINRDKVIRLNETLIILILEHVLTCIPFWRKRCVLLGQITRTKEKIEKVLCYVKKNS